MVHHGAGWLIHHAPAAVAQGKGQVELLVERRRVAVVEPAHLLECLPADQDACADRHVHVADEVEFRRRRVAPGTVGQAPAVAQHRAAGFLHRAVRVQQLGADQAHQRVGVGKAHERRQPAWPHRPCRC